MVIAKVQQKQKSQSALQIGKPEVSWDIIIVAGSINLVGPEEAWGTRGGPEPALVPGKALKEGSSCTRSDKATFAFPSLSCPALCSLSHTAALPRGTGPALSI